MKKTLVVILVLCMFVGFAHSQDKDNKWRQGNIGLVFEFDGLGNLNLDEFDGGLGAIIYLGSFAVRPLIIFQTGKEESPHSSGSPPPIFVGDVTTTTDLGFGVDFLLPLAPGRVSPYFGVGGFFKSGTEEEKKQYDSTVQPGPNIDKTTTTTFGGKLILGVEAFIWPNFSLAGEYHIGYSLEKEKETKTYVDGTPPTLPMETTDSSMGIRTRGVLVATFYFKK